MATAPKMYGQRHGKQRRREHRKNSYQRGYNKEWTRLREEYITNNPLCAHCLAKGRTTIAREIDHIKPFEGLHDPLRLDTSNLQSLCRKCHSIKTTKEQG